MHYERYILPLENATIYFLRFPTSGKKALQNYVLAMVVTMSVTFFINFDITDKVVVDDLVILFIVPNNHHS
jgi:hypothetical protein